MTAPTHRRSLTFEATDTDDGVRVVGRLRDERPWATDPRSLPTVHDLELDVEVRRADQTITAARARMYTYPHAECPGIEAAFGQLVGMSVRRGYTRGLQERLRGVSGCTHLLELARAMGPAVMQATFSSLARARADHEPEPDISLGEDDRVGLMLVLRNTCHVWDEHDGVGVQKLARGWRPGTTAYPVPALDTFPAPPD